MAPSLLAFIAQHLGFRVQSPGGLGGQCVDLVELWALAQGARAIPGNATDLLNNASFLDWMHTLNTPVNFPPAGAIVVWGEEPAHEIGPYGHTAVALGADAHWLLTADQAWPPGAPVSVVVHDYRGVKGWLQRRG